MKKITSLLLFLFFTSLISNGATYYTCNVSSGTNLTTSSTGGGTCNVAIGTWNNASHTIVIRTGTTFNLSGNLTLNCQVIVEDGGVLNNITSVNTTTLNTSGNYNVPANISQLTVTAWGGGGAGGGSTIANAFEGRGGAGGGGGARAQSVITVTPGSVLAVVVGAGGTGVVAGNGNNGGNSTITGFSTQIFAEGGKGGGVNTGNTPSGGAAGLAANSIGATVSSGTGGENGASGFGISSGSGGEAANPGGGTGGASIGSGSSNGNNGNAPGGAGGGARSSGGFTGGGGNRPGGNGGAGRVVIEYNVAAALTFANNVTLSGTVNGGAVTIGTASVFVGTGALNFSSLTVNATTPASFVDNFRLSQGAVSGTGSIKILRNLSTSNNWYELGFAVKSGTVADLVSTGFPIRDASYPANLRNIYRWDAGAADWVAAATTTSLTETALKIFAFGTSPSISITVSATNFNNSTLAEALDWNDGQSSIYLTGGIDVTEGWNNHYNPFQAFIDWDNVEPVLDANSEFTNLGVAVKNNTGSYEYYNGGVGTARYIAPTQGFWLQSNNTVAAPTTFSYTNAMRNSTPGTPVSSFKTNTITPKQITLKLNGPNGEVLTHVAKNVNATDSFDAGFDMRWFQGDHEHFYTLDNNGNKYGINQSGAVGNAPIPLAFSHTNNGVTYSISADLEDWDNNIEVFVKDTYLNITTSLSNNNSYTFSNVTAASENRFMVLFVPVLPCITNTFTPMLTANMYANAGANQVETYYWGLSTGFIQANPENGVGPYTYNWTNSAGYSMKGTSNKKARLLYPTGPTWVKVAITDEGAGCTTEDSIYIDWIDFTCNQPDIWFYEMCNLNTLTSVCVAGTRNMRDSVKTGNYIFGSCNQPVKTGVATQSNFGVNVFPNPSNGKVSIIMANANKSMYDIHVMDINGRVLFSTQLNSTDGYASKELDLSELARGVYIMRVSDENNSATQRIVIQ